MEPFLVGSHLEDNILLERGWEGRRSKAGGGLGGRAQRLPPRRWCSRCCTAFLLDAGRHWCFLKLDGGWGEGAPRFLTLVFCCCCCCCWSLLVVVVVVVVVAVVGVVVVVGAGAQKKYGASKEYFRAQKNKKDQKKLMNPGCKLQAMRLVHSQAEMRCCAVSKTN